MGNTLPRIALLVALLSVSLSYICYSYAPAVQRSIRIMGVLRRPSAVKPEDPGDLVLIEGTTHCEDIHYHEPSHLLFTACEDSHVTRFGWFPPLASFDASVLHQARGGLFVIDPDTKKAHKLQLQGFSGPFITHGIDVISDPNDRMAVYIFAVNHLPNPDYYSWSENFAPKLQGTGKHAQAEKARSQVEIFHHRIRSSTARHVRSVWNPLITTPNDVLALNPSHFLVTNDHFYREGLMRDLEDMYTGATWSNTVSVELSDLSAAEPDTAVKASVVIDSIHNNNGLGHGRSAEELLVCSAAGGTLHFGELQSLSGNYSVRIDDVLQLDSTVDNPSYFLDPYAAMSGSLDASGVVLPGLGRAIDLRSTRNDPHAIDPVVVWHARRVNGTWEKRLIFEDDGTTIRSASAAVLVAIDPARENGRRRAWLYVTGFSSSHVVAVKVDL